MQKKEWVVSLCILCALALISAGLTAFVLEKNQPENVEAFENRFLDLTQLGISAPETVKVNATRQRITFDWPAAQEKLLIQTQPQALEDGTRELKLTLGAGGSCNGFQKERWGCQVWLELQLFSNGRMTTAQRTEVPLLSENPDRTRVYTVCSKTDEADSWKLCVIITPLEGSVAEGTFILNNCEVTAE